MPTPTATLSPGPLYLQYPFHPMFELTTFPPTVTPAARPIPPLPAYAQQKTTQPAPGWLAAVSPSAGSVVPLVDAERTCVTTAERHFFNCSHAQQSNCAFPLLPLFYRGERVRDHLYLEVNGIVPSELTWQDIIVPNSTHPGTAWVGIRTYGKFCWPVDLTAGLYEAVLHYPTETGEASYIWYFTSE
jgi:hypothetical protein